MDVILVFYSKKNLLIGEYLISKEQRFNKRLNRKKSILDLALDNNVDVKFGCMGGSCSACICEIISGEEFIEIGGIKEQIFKTQGKEFLSCMATIKEDLEKIVKIEIKLKL